MSRFLKSSFSGVFAGALLLATQAQAITLTQQPLFLSSGAEPNVMFVLDDSYSMQDEIMPEGIIVPKTGNTVFSVFPQPQKVYTLTASTTGTQNPQNRVATPGSLHWKVTHSINNSIYYDPTVRYTPWVKADGTSYNDAPPSCAPHYPEWSGTRTNSPANCRDLTASVASGASFDGRTPTWVNCATAASTPCTGATGAYYPAAYYPFTGNPAVTADVWNAANYGAEVQIKSTTLSYTIANGSNRTDCSISGTTATCLYAAEIQNFANWYTYYRSRLLLSKGAVGKAFVKQTDAMRVGFGVIGKGSTTIDGQATTIVKSGVRTFDLSTKALFYTDLYSAGADVFNTPLRNALDGVGKYYSRSDAKSPWADFPATGKLADNVTNQLPTSHAACRQSYTILMTDGYWNDDGVSGRPNPPSGIANEDNTAGSVQTNHNPNPVPATYTFAANTSPFYDAYSNTLADVAMKYWKTDLRADLQNKLRPTAVDPAFWQHMTTFTIGLGVFGTKGNIDVESAITTPQSISWPNAIAGIDNPEKIDDLLHAGINGHGDFFSAKNPDELSTNLGSMLSNVIKREVNNAAAAAANSTSLNNNSVIYQALFNSVEWTGQLTATSLDAFGTLSATPLWTATTPTPVSNRKIFTYNDATRAGGILAWANLSPAQIALLNGGDAYGADRLAWLGGVNPTAPVGVAGDIRDRTNLIGDIVNSDPSFAGINNLRFEGMTGVAGNTSYPAFYKTQRKVRREMLYVGANDGMLHGFNAHIPVSGDGLAGIPAGEEVFAYVPSQAFAKVKKLASRQYGKDATHPHQYTVDGPTDIQDAYFNSAWHTILVGSLGAGGRGIYVLDVTDPDNFSASSVLFELTDAQYPELGNITGLATVAPGRDGRWKIFLGNGYSSTKGGKDTAYLGIIDIEDEVNKVAIPNRTVFIAANSAAAILAGTTAPNGLAAPALLPDANGMIKAVYAGDLQGNLWKFDVSSTSSASWAVAYGDPLFTAKRSGVAQPITAAPNLGLNGFYTPGRVMVYFGTGQYLEANDKQTGTAVQSFYAIVDKGAAITVTNRSTLHQKTMTTIASTRVISGQTTGTAPNLTNAVPWATVDGWYLDFTPGERVITKPVLLADRLIFPTVIPNPDACQSGGTGWMMELIAVGDKNLNYTLLAGNANSFLSVPIIGRFTALTGGLKDSSDPATKTDPCTAQGSGTIAIVGTDTEGKAKIPTGCSPKSTLGRQSWRELR